MDSFGFTRKKFLSLAEKNQHRHLIAWLSGFYQKLATNRVEITAFDQFCSQYETLLGWIKAPSPIRPSQGTRRQIEYISDAIQFHRKASGTPLRDDTLLGQISLPDRTIPGEPLLNTEYQVALDGLRSLFNVGSIFRTCDAAGVRSVILGNTLGHEDPRVQKTAMGAQKWVTQEKTSDLAQTLMEKKKQGFRIIGLETIPGSIPYQEYTWPSKAVFVFGNEEYGISSHVMAALGDIVHIPMFGIKNSLNVANAMAVILFQAVLSPNSQN
jgi:23S rRNA (guanosine2251-2'-O)-methyltransferase